MNVLIKNGYVEGFALAGKVVGGVDVPELTGEELARFTACPSAYRLTQAGTLELDPDKFAQLTNEAELEALRRRRAAECFPIINRGALWYDRLTDEQRAELDAWYQAWLDVTETREVPALPAFVSAAGQ